MSEKNIFNQKAVLDKLGLNISSNSFEESIKNLNVLCSKNPFKTQSFVQVFFNAWCGKILSMIDNNNLNDAGTRIRSLFVTLKYNKAFNKLLIIYLDKIVKNKVMQNLKSEEKAVNFSMLSYYFHEVKNYDEAEHMVISCFQEIKKNLSNNPISSTTWLLIQKSLKNIRNKKKAEELLTDILKKISN
tara:strand:+ start:751 stop:1311 length:561 start_codon:yes stop_codon:yes gene_type:complete